MSSAVVLLNEIKKPTANSKDVKHGCDKCDSSASCAPLPRSLSVNLPKIDLPKFDRRIETWVTFKNAFCTLIHEEQGLDKLQKLNYLQLSLAGKTEDAIGAFVISEENYKAAWEDLCRIGNSIPNKGANNIFGKWEGSVEQWVESLLSAPGVVSSNPAWTLSFFQRSYIYVKFTITNAFSFYVTQLFSATRLWCRTIRPKRFEIS
ncbi:hypothetical protein WN55_06240 [Dufourea novaeangliae]|uniref:Uncharacterized protein n=1 Tax=Dufourea novaeangliae TaxID=178035 RepID=A0A154PQ59_DUFNO|nr:hypothetical protein WN55_06240 [Dufourea novaeangliae]